MKRMLLLVTTFLLSLLIFAAVSAQEATDPPLIPPNGEILSDMYARINALRERRGLPPYRLNDSLTLAAQDQAQYLVRTGQRGHYRGGSSRPSLRAAAFGFTSSHWCCGENYYMSIDATPDMVFDFWRWSPSHVVNLLHRDFTDIGLGMSSDGYRISYVTLFGEADDLHPPEPAEAQNVATSEGAPPAPEAAVPALAVEAAAAAPAAEYIVLPGDTLARIAARNGTTVQALMTANNISNPEIIYVGQRLVLAGAAAPQIPAEAPPETQVSASEPQPAPAAQEQPGLRHVVVEGETLAQIAARYGTTVQTLVAANNIVDPSIIYSGQVLNIPAPQ